MKTEEIIKLVQDLKEQVEQLKNSSEKGEVFSLVDSGRGLSVELQSRIYCSRDLTKIGIKTFDWLQHQRDSSSKKPSGVV